MLAAMTGAALGTTEGIFLVERNFLGPRCIDKSQTLLLAAVGRPHIGRQDTLLCCYFHII